MVSFTRLQTWISQFSNFVNDSKTMKLFEEAAVKQIIEPINYLTSQFRKLHILKPI